MESFECCTDEKQVVFLRIGLVTLITIMPIISVHHYVGDVHNTVLHSRI